MYSGFPKAMAVNQADIVQGRKYERIVSWCEHMRRNQCHCTPRDRPVLVSFESPVITSQVGHIRPQLQSKRQQHHRARRSSTAACYVAT